MSRFFLSQKTTAPRVWRAVSAALIVALLILSTDQSASAQQSSAIISQIASQQFGLKREWVTHIEVDPDRTKVTKIFLSFDKLFALTEDGLLQAIDSETGKTDWKVRLGKPGYPSFGPGADAKHVSIVNGSTLYVVKRENGEMAWSVSLSGAAGAGPAVSEKAVFVPMARGLLEGYDIEDHKHSPWHYPTDGRSFVQPLIANGRIAWPTVKGFMYVAKADPPEVLFRVEARDRISGQAAYKSPNFYMTSLDGNLYAFDENNGNIDWRFVAGQPINKPPVVINDRVYITPVENGMFCVSTETGKAIWHAPRVERFLSASEKRIYASDRYNRLHILDAETGASLGSLPRTRFSLQVTNWQTDRIYVGTTDGVLQCIREADLDEPIRHAKPPGVEDAPETPAEGKQDEASPTDPPADKPDEGEEVNPFAP